MTWRLEPAAARIAVEVTDETAARMDAAGLVLPYKYVGDKPTVGQVSAVCANYAQDGEEFEAIYPIGTWVMFGKFTGSEIQLDRKKYIVLRETDVIAVLRSDDEPVGSTPMVKINART